MIISTNTEILVAQIQYQFLIKIVSKLEIEEMFMNLVRYPQKTYS